MLPRAARLRCGAVRPGDRVGHRRSMPGPAGKFTACGQEPLRAARPGAGSVTCGRGVGAGWSVPPSRSGTALLEHLSYRERQGCDICPWCGGAARPTVGTRAPVGRPRRPVLPVPRSSFTVSRSPSLVRRLSFVVSRRPTHSCRASRAHRKEPAPPRRSGPLPALDRGAVMPDGRPDTRASPCPCDRTPGPSADSAGVLRRRAAPRSPGAEPCVWQADAPCPAPSRSAADRTPTPAPVTPSSRPDATAAVRSPRVPAAGPRVASTATHTVPMTVPSTSEPPRDTATSAAPEATDGNGRPGERAAAGTTTS